MSCFGLIVVEQVHMSLPGLEFVSTSTSAEVWKTHGDSDLWLLWMFDGSSISVSYLLKSPKCSIIHSRLHRLYIDGVPSFISANRVILSPGIEGVIAADYILKLRDLRTGTDMNLSTARSIFTASDK